jgi:tetratricopeptide (TPR) repeat protein
MDVPFSTKFVEAYYIRGEAYLSKGQFDRAIADFNKALEINPKDALAYYKMAGAYYKKKEYDKCLENAKKAQELGLGIDSKAFEILRNLLEKDR